jgi:hypothetical protein
MALGFLLMLVGMLSFPLMEYMMYLIVEDSGWPYWPPVYAPPRNFERVAGIIGLIIREVYIHNLIIIVTGTLLLVFAISIRYLDSRP